MKIREVKSYVTSDGRSFGVRSDAEGHQARLDATRRLLAAPSVKRAMVAARARRARRAVDGLGEAVAVPVLRGLVVARIRRRAYPRTQLAVDLRVSDRATGEAIARDVDEAAVDVATAVRTVAERLNLAVDKELAEAVATATFD